MVDGSKTDQVLIELDAIDATTAIGKGEERVRDGAMHVVSRVRAVIAQHDSRPTVTPAPAPQPVAPRRCGNPTCYAHDGETCAKGAMERGECEEWHRCAPQPVSGEVAKRC